MMRKLNITEMGRISIDEFRHSRKMPLVVVLDDVRSLYNVGSVFRTADAYRVSAIYLCGITACPYDPTTGQPTSGYTEIHKTALGAEDSVAWRYFPTADAAVQSLRKDQVQVWAVEQAEGSTPLQQFHPAVAGSSGSDEAPFPPTYAVVLGNEVKGVHQSVVDMCDGCLELPQFGTKHSLNVSTTAGIVIWEFARALLLGQPSFH